MPRTITALLAATAALAIPAGVTAQAGASTSKGGCTVTPKKPYVLSTIDVHGHKVVFYPVHYTCQGNKRLQTRQRAYEDDSTSRTLIASWNETHNVGPSGASKTDGFRYHVLRWDTDDEVELYQQVSFRVCVPTSDDCSGWTPYEKSPVLSVPIP